jgi:hypothetical protein
MKWIKEITTEATTTEKPRITKIFYLTKKEICPDEMDSFVNPFAFGEGILRKRNNFDRMSLLMLEREKPSDLQVEPSQIKSEL